MRRSASNGHGVTGQCVVVRRPRAVAARLVARLVSFGVALFLAAALFAPAAGAVSFATSQGALTPSDQASYDELGGAVAISGDTALVAAPYKTVNGQSDAGAVYVYVQSAGSWTQQAEFTGAGTSDEYFGDQVAIDGDTALVESAGTGLVYVFVRGGSAWSQQAVLSGPGGDLLTGGLALAGDVALVGDPSSAAPGPTAGAVCVFARSGTTWSLSATLTASDAAAGDSFGTAVSLSGDTALIGAPVKTFPYHSQAGAAYVFVDQAGTWSQQAELVPSDATSGDAFGESVALSGGTAVVSAPDKAIDDHGGIVYVFGGSGASWTQQAELSAADGAAGFGRAIATTGDAILVGASGRGSFYVFGHITGGWSEQMECGEPNAASGDLFGDAVALSGGEALIGDPGRSYYANGVHTYAAGTAYPYLLQDDSTAPTTTATLSPPEGPGGTETGPVTVTLSASDDLSGVATTYFREGCPRGWLVYDPQNPPIISVHTADLYYYSVDAAGNAEPVQEVTVGISSGSSHSGSATARHVIADGPAGSSPSPSTGHYLAVEAALSPTEVQAPDEFADSVALSGDTALVGAPGRTVDGVAEAGAVYVYERSAGVWTEETRLDCPIPSLGAQFGYRVALCGDTALVGAYGLGVVYVYSDAGGGWAQQSELVPAEHGYGDYGASLALDGDTALIGAPGSPTGTGCAFVFISTNGVWSEQAEWTNNWTGFGSSVALSGDTALVGDPLFGVTETGRGAAYVYTRSGTTWSQQGGLGAADGAAFDCFGAAVALDGTTAVVSSPDHANGGAVYVFSDAGGGWAQVDEMPSGVFSAGNPCNFGSSVALQGTQMAVGDPNGDVRGSAGGGLYLLSGTGAGWTVDPGFTAPSDFFSAGVGTAVALDAGTILTSAPAPGAAYLLQDATDTTPPQTTATITPAPNAAGWSRTPVTVTLAGSDSQSGVDSLLYRVGSTGDYGWYNSESPIQVATQGVTEIFSYATDVAGNVGTPTVTYVRIDSRRPTLSAPYAATVVRGHKAILKYRVNDPRPGSPSASVVIDVKNARGKVVRVLTYKNESVGKLLAASFVCKLARGSYRFYVRATDTAGNPQVRIVSNRLTVR